MSAMSGSVGQIERTRVLSVSVVVCSHGRESHLHSLLGNNELRRADELIIITESPIDIATECDDVTILENDESGLPAARNTGLEIAENDIIVFIDDDFWPQEGWFAALAETFSSDDAVVAVGGPSLLVAPDHEFEVTPDGEISFNSLHEVVDDSYRWKPEQPVDVPTLPGSNMSFRASAVGNLRFDESFKGNYYREETDFVQRLRDGNPERRVVYHPDACGYHVRTYSGGCSSDAYDYWSAHNHAHFLQKRVGYGAIAYLLGHVFNPFANYMSNPPTVFDVFGDPPFRSLLGYVVGLRNNAAEC